MSKEQWARHRIGYVSGEFDVDFESCPGHGTDCSDFEKKHAWCDACRYRFWSSVMERGEDQRKVRIVGKRIVGHVVYPLTSYSGAAVGFQVRSLTEKAFDNFTLKRRPEGFFFGCTMNFQEIWSSKEAVIVEGPSDQLVIERLAAPNVLSLTTSGLSKGQLQYLRRFVKRVASCLDRDGAGRRGFRSLMSREGEPFEVVDVKYPCVSPKDKDPGDLWKRLGDDKFRSAFSKAFASAGIPRL